MTEDQPGRREQGSATDALPGIAMVLAWVALSLGLFLDSGVGGILFIPLFLVGVQLRVKQGGWWRRGADSG